MTYRHAGMTLILPSRNHSSTPVPQHPILLIIPNHSHHSSKTHLHPPHICHIIEHIGHKKRSRCQVRCVSGC